MSFRPGERLVGGYEVLQLLGRGAHGVVLKVRGPGGANRFRAVKVLPCDSPGSSSLGPAGAAAAAAESRDAAYREARLLQRLRYPHIVHCEDVIWDYQRRSVLLVLELMDGGDLRGLIEAQRATGELFEAHFARRVLAAVGGALAYIHQAGVLHRDVKPANVLLTRHLQRIKLADFGIAKLLETSHAHTVVGTPHYLSPEILSGKAYGEASDAWALGVCLYEVAATHRPFDASNQLALVRRICEEPFAQLPDGVAVDVRRAVEGMLEKTVEQRLSIPEALVVSSAVAALVVGGVACSQVSRAAPPKAAVGTGKHLAKRSPPVAHRDSKEAQLVAALPPTGSASSPSSLSSSERASGKEAVEGCSVGSFSSGWLSSSAPSSPCSPAAGGMPHTTMDEEEDEEEEDSSAEMQPAEFATSSDRWQSESQYLWAEVEASWCGSEAAVAAREALGGDIDDPEELVRALAALEKEHDDSSGLQGATALETLESELRVRIAALRTDAAAMLETAEAEAEDEEDRPGADTIPRISGVGLLLERARPGTDHENASVCSSPRCSMLSSRAATAFEQALEVATSLGVDTDPCEERFARKRGMLSLRVKWCGVARFCLLPVNVGFDSLIAEVSRRFGLASVAALPGLSWQEAGDSFKLRSQACWEECLQRRGLVTQPGRLELCVDSFAPPPASRAVHLRAATRSAALEAFASAPSPLGHRPELFSWRPGPAGMQGRGRGRGQESFVSTFFGATASTLRATSVPQSQRLFRAGQQKDRTLGEELEAVPTGDAGLSTVSSFGYAARSPQHGQALLTSSCRHQGPGGAPSEKGPTPLCEVPEEKRPTSRPPLTAVISSTRSRPCIQVRCRVPVAGDGRDRVSPHGLHQGQMFGAAVRNLQVNGRAVPLQ